MPVLAYHVIFSAYGHWLPNDPRGSGSSFVGSKKLLPYGQATGLDDRSRSVARRPHDRKLRQAAKEALQRPAVLFTGIQARTIGQGFKYYIDRAKLLVWACSILPDHVHMVIARHHYLIEQVVIQLKSAATRQLVGSGQHPFLNLRQQDEEPPDCWGRGEWKVFLNSEADILREIEYVEENPLKEGKPRQSWSFVIPYPHRYPGPISQ